MGKSSGTAAARRPDGMPVGTPFPKGVSGNPAGLKPGTVSIKTELQKLINLTLKGEINPLTELQEDNMPVGRKIALNLVVKAVADGDMWAIKQIMENLEGKPAQSLNIGGQDGENPIQLDSKLTVELVRPKGSSNG